MEASRRYTYRNFLVICILALLLILFTVFADHMTAPKPLLSMSHMENGSRVYNGVKLVGDNHLKNTFLNYNQEDKISDHEKKVNTKSSKTPKLILWYIKARYIRPTGKPRPLSNCPWKCSITTNRKYQNKSSALLFAAQILRGEVPRRHGDQVFVFHNHEPSNLNHFSRTSDLNEKRWKNQVNWTMWYRTDSDIHEPYGLIQKREQVKIAKKKNYSHIYKNKTKMVAWVVSNCRTMSRRKEYVKELQKYIEVDIYGQCGKQRCSRSTHDNCQKMLEDKYKFYLAFENNFCKDYVTEKFFSYYSLDLINVARGDGDSYRKVAPNGTYINTADFKSAKELAQYLKRLANDEEHYISYLKRKDEYECLEEEYPIVRGKRVVYLTHHYEEQPMCELCRRLWNVDKYRKTYPDIYKWFKEKTCYPPKDLS